MATYFKNIDMNQILIGDEEQGNNGGKYRKVSYKGGQLKGIQLGSGVNDLIRCPFGIEPVAQNQPDKFCIKLEANEHLSTFIQTLDQKVIDCVNDSKLTHRSTLKLGTISNNLKIKIQPDTQILITTMKSPSVLTPPAKGSMKDITPNSMVLPIIKIQGGVYFIEDNYGTSMVATQVLIVNGSPSSETIEFCLGDGVKMEE